MNRHIIGFCIFLVFVISNVHAQDDEISLVTYYPIPYGSYRDIYASIMYDFDDRNYYVDSGGRSILNTVNIENNIILKRDGSKLKFFRLNDELYNLELAYDADRSRRWYYLKTSRLGAISLDANLGEAGNIFIPEGELRIGASYSAPSPRLALKHNGTDGIIETDSGPIVFELPGGNDIVKINDSIFLVDNSNQLPKDADNNVIDYKLYTQDQAIALLGKSTSNIRVDSGIYGTNTAATGGAGIIGQGSSQSVGVLGYTGTAPDASAGYFIRGTGVFGFSNTGAPGVLALNKAASNGGTALYAGAYKRNRPALYAEGSSTAAVFKGHLIPDFTQLVINPAALDHGWALRYATSNLGSTDQIIGFGGNRGYWRVAYVNNSHFGRGDITEGFYVSSDAEPGDVVVIDKDGNAKLCNSEGDNKILGVVSTEPAIIIKQALKEQKDITLLGTTPVRVDATKYSIEPGDLLTTSGTPGHAMKCVDPKVGIILGKAMEGLKEGKGKIKVLVSPM